MGIQIGLNLAFALASAIKEWSRFVHLRYDVLDCVRDGCVVGIADQFHCVLRFGHIGWWLRV